MSRNSTYMIYDEFHHTDQAGDEFDFERVAERLNEIKSIGKETPIRVLMNPFLLTKLKDQHNSMIGQSIPREKIEMFGLPVEEDKTITTYEFVYRG